MALIGSMTKQPREALPVDISYTGVLAGRAATLISPVVEVPVGMTLVSQELAGDQLQLYVGGGTDQMSYRWTILTSITIGGKITIVEDEFDVVVEAV